MKTRMQPIRPTLLPRDGLPKYAKPEVTLNRTVFGITNFDCVFGTEGAVRYECQRNMSTYGTFLVHNNCTSTFPLSAIFFLLFVYQF